MSLCARRASSSIEPRSDRASNKRPDSALCLGLGPKLFQDLLQSIRALQHATGMSVLLVEQNVREALKVPDRVLVMKSGAIICEAVPRERAESAKLMELY